MPAVGLPTPAPSVLTPAVEAPTTLPGPMPFAPGPRVPPPRAPDVPPGTTPPAAGPMVPPAIAPVAPPGPTPTCANAPVAATKIDARAGSTRLTACRIGAPPQRAPVHPRRTAHAHGAEGAR